MTMTMMTLLWPVTAAHVAHVSQPTTYGHLPAVLQAHQPAIQLESQPTSVQASTPSNTPQPRVLLPPKIISVTRNRVPFPAIIPGNREVRLRLTKWETEFRFRKQNSVSCHNSTIAPRILHNHLHDLEPHQPWTNRRPPPVTKHQPHYLPVVKPDEEAPIRLPAPPQHSIHLITSCTPARSPTKLYFTSSTSD